jgi:NitT/TauT family transport system ATP-binding protein
MTAASGRIEISRLGVRFESAAGEVEALHDVSMTVEPGSFVSIIGPSGCGKSTLLNAVAGFVRPTTGSVLVDGKSIDGPGAERGVVFQQYSLFPWRTVRGNVEFGLKMKGMAKPEREAQARTLLGLAGLLAFENHYPDALSGGMKQRVGIVRALAPGPQMLLMDEPFGALDAQTRSVMQQILTNMWQRLRISVLFITHDIDEAIFLSDRVYVMTARPGMLKTAIDVPLPRPRKPEMVTSPGFLDLRGTLIRLVREESLKAMGGELADGALDGLGLDVGPEGISRML